MAISKLILNDEVQMDVTSNTNTANNMLSGVVGTKNDGTSVTGNIATKTSSDLTASGATITAPAGYYANAASKAVATTTHPNPSASITSSTGVVTASHTQSTGYVIGGTTTGTLNLTTQAGKTVTPTETAQTAVASYRWTTGPVSVAAISSTYVGTGVTTRSAADLTASGSVVTAPAGYYSTAATKAVAAGSAFPPAVTITKAPTFSMNSATGVVTASYTGSSSITPTVTSGYITAGTAGIISTTGTSTYQLASTAAATYYPSTADQTISSYRWLTGTQTIKSVVTSNLTAANIAEGVIVKVGDSSNASRITQITGTYSGETTYTCTISGTGNSSKGYVEHNSIKYYTNSSSFEFTAGDTLYLYAGVGYTNYIKINGHEEVFATQYNSAEYYYTLPPYPVTISMSMETTTATINIVVPSITITNNGFYDVTSCATADVDVHEYKALITDGQSSDAPFHITYNGVKYYTSSSYFYFNEGDVADLHIDRYNATYSSTYVNINGENISSSQGSTNYSYVFPAGNVNFSFKQALNPGNTIDVYEQVFPSSVLMVSQNGQYNVYGYSGVSVNIPGGGSDAEDAIIQRTISGTYENSRITKIGEYAFANAYSLITVSFQNVTSIYTMAFRYCRNLISANFPNATYIGGSAFYSCSQLASISFPKALSISESAFISCWSLTEANFPSVTYIGGCAFQYCSSLTSISFPNASYIGYSAFVSCWSLTEANFPSVTTMGAYAFQYCSSLTTISLPICTSIPSGTFSSCIGLTAVNLPKVTRIYSSAFLRCTNLTTVSFSNLTKIDASAFTSCYNLLSVYLLTSTKVTLMNINAFTSTPISTYTTSTGGVYGSIFVPSSLYSSYISDAVWSYYSARIVGMSWNQLTSENCTIVSATMDGTNYYLGATLAYNTTVISAPTIKVTFKGQEYICSQYSGTMNGYTTYAYGANSDIPTLTPHFDNGHPFLLWCQTRNNINLNNIVIDSNVVEEGEIVPIVIEEQVNSLP